MASTRNMLAAVIACTAYFAFGLMESTIANSLMDLAEITGTSVRIVNNGNAAALFAYCMGCLFFGLLSDLLDHRIVAAFSLAACAVVQYLMPQNTDVSLLYLSLMSSGFARGGLDTGLNTWMMTMWGQKANAVLLTMHSCYTLSCSMTPVLFAPFLSVPPDKWTGFSGRASRIRIPFTIVSGFSILPLALIIMHRLSYSSFNPQSFLCRLNSSLVTPAEPTQWQQRGWRKVVRIALTCSCVGLYSGMDVVMMTLLPQFAVFSDLHLSKGTALIILTSVLVCALVFKLLSAFVTCCIAVKGMIVMDLAVMWMGNVLMLLFSDESEAAMWLSANLIGIGAGSCMPSLLSFFGQKISSSGQNTGYLLAASRITSVPVTLLISAFLKDVPLVFVYANLASVSIAALSFFVLLYSVK